MGTSGRKINVLFVLIQVSTGGAERVVLDLARNLNRSVFNVFAAYFIDGNLRGPLAEVCKELFRNPKKEGFDPGAMLRLSKIIREKHIDVINAHHYMPYFYSYPGSKLLHKRALIYTEHSVAEVEGVYSGVHKRLFNLMLHNTDAVAGVSKEIAETFKKRFPAHSRKIVSLPNGVDVERYSVHADRDHVRAEWGVSPEHFVIGTVANFRKGKNHACLIRAFKRLSALYPHVRLVLVGRGYPLDEENSEEDVKGLINTNKLGNRIVLTGYQEDIPRLLQSFDAFCLPSFSEGLPVSVLESMAARVPVVGSDVRGIREVISHEETGLLFPSDDDHALAQNLERLIKNQGLCESLREKAFTFVSQAHGLKKWVSTYESLFQDNV